MNSRAHVFVSGRVQGVFFRSEAQDQAQRLGLTGWIRNLPDGRVEAVFEGEVEKIKQMIQLCKQGSPGAIVSAVKVLWESFTGGFRDFRILY